MEITLTFPGNKKTLARVGDFEVLTDQPVMAGGDGAATTPFALFLTSIVSCAGIFLVHFCQKRDIPTDNIKIVQRVERNPETGRIDRISLDIVVPDDFPDKYRNALINTVDLCSVKKTMLDPPEFDVRTVTAG